MIKQLGKQAKTAAKEIAIAETGQKNTFLTTLADLLLSQSAAVLANNALDIADGEAAGLTPALLDRLMLNPQRLEGMANDLRSVAALPDPVGETFDKSTLPNGLRVTKQRVPLGVLAVVYEARPNITADIAGLAIKTGNVAILRGGSETLRSNKALVDLIQTALQATGFPKHAIQLIADPDRALVMDLIQMYEYVDMLIPRGGAGLHQFCIENSRVPVITGGIGICHLFVDETADLEATVPVIHNAKTQRPSVCNSLDTVLVHRAAADATLVKIVDGLSPSGVTFRADPAALASLQRTMAPGTMSDVVFPADEGDFDTEWLSLVLGLKVVDSIQEAIDHIQAHSTGHSDGILTSNQQNSQRFIKEIDSAAVFVNASTRFNDGSQFGLGAEVAISTQRLHARGPMGPRELTTYKWVVQGDYHVRG